VSTGRNTFALAAILAATTAAYVPCLEGDFLFDDETLLRAPHVVAPLEQSAASWLGSTRPVAALTFALNRAIGGVAPLGWHLVNLAVHLAAALLAWRLALATLRRAGLPDPERPALAAAALFALHPLQSQAVAYLSQRSEALGSALYLGAFLLLLRWDEAAGGARRARLLGGALALGALGLLTKPIVATLPAAWLLHAAILPAPGEEGVGAVGRVRRRLAAAAPLLALSAAAAAWELRSNEGSTSAGLAIPGLSQGQYLLAQLEVVPTYLRLALLPIGQNADWDVRPSAPWEAVGALLLAALVVAAIALAARGPRWGGNAGGAARTAAFGFLFFLLALLPSSSVVPLKDLLEEHRVYLPLLGLAMGAAAAGAAILRRWVPGRAFPAGAALLVAALLPLGVATALRAETWTTHRALWSDVARKSPGKARAHLNLGTALSFEGRWGEALASYRRAQALQGDGTVEPEMVLEDLVAALTRLVRFDEARAAIAAELRRTPGASHPLSLLAEVEWAAGRDAECERAALGSLAGDPANPLALRYLAKVRAGQGRWAEARDLLRAAVPALARDAGAWLDLGRAEARLGDRAGACGAWERATAQGGLEGSAAEARAELLRMGCR
jgi:tetratricopeptide (TPR) repeat protein